MYVSIVNIEKSSICAALLTWAARCENGVGMVGRSGALGAAGEGRNGRCTIVEDVCSPWMGRLRLQAPSSCAMVT
jgi:hypothetical protein